MKKLKAENKGRLITDLNEGNISDIQSQYYFTPRASLFWERATGRRKRVSGCNSLTANVR
jgi:hypothetical protein